MSYVTTYPPNTTIQFNASIYNVTGALVDPTSVLFFVQGPDGTFGQYNATRISAGIYYYNYTTQATPGGRWYYWYQGIGTVQVQSDYIPFEVDIQPF